MATYLPSFRYVLEVCTPQMLIPFRRSSQSDCTLIQHDENCRFKPACVPEVFNVNASVRLLVSARRNRRLRPIAQAPLKLLHDRLPRLKRLQGIFCTLPQSRLEYWRCVLLHVTDRRSFFLLPFVCFAVYTGSTANPTKRARLLG